MIESNAILRLSAGLAVALAGCALGPVDNYCSSDTACPLGWTCAKGSCHRLCATDADCEPGDFCDTRPGYCVRPSLTDCLDVVCDAPNACELPDGALCHAGECRYRPRSAGGACDDGDACTGDDQCNGHGYCAGTAMECPSYLCLDDDDCGPGETCVDDNCLGLAGTACAVNGECLDVCIDGTCDAVSSNLEPCDDDGDCSEGNVCSDDVCLKIPGVPCDDPSECRSDICTDGICCDLPCDSPCFSCETGTCTPHAYGDPGACDAGYFCCGNPFTCEPPSPDCPG